MRRLIGLAAAFALLVGGIESLRVLVAWWHAGRPTPGPEEALACVVLVVALAAWWRHSAFACRDDRCRPPPGR